MDMQIDNFVNWWVIDFLYQTLWKEELLYTESEYVRLKRIIDYLLETKDKEIIVLIKEKFQKNKQTYYDSDWVLEIYMNRLVKMMNCLDKITIKSGIKYYVKLWFPIKWKGKYYDMYNRQKDKMVNWLSHPWEFWSVPNKIELFAIVVSKWSDESKIIKFIDDKESLDNIKNWNTSNLEWPDMISFLWKYFYNDGGSTWMVWISWDYSVFSSFKKLDEFSVEEHYNYFL